MGPLPRSPAARAEAPTQKDERSVVFFEGLRGRILEGKLGRAMLVSAESVVTVEANGDVPARFEFGDLTVSDPLRLFPFERYSAVALPQSECMIYGHDSAAQQ